MSSISRPFQSGIAFNSTTFSLGLDSTNFNLNTLDPDQCTSWAGEWPCAFPEDLSVSNTALQGGCGNADNLFPLYQPVGTALNTGATRGFASEHTLVDAEMSTAPLHLDVTPQQQQEEPYTSNQGRYTDQNDDRCVRQQILFQEIAQPPAAVLIGGSKRWRRLQRYFCRISEQSRAVNRAFLCVVELLAINDVCGPDGEDRDEYMKKILECHQSACNEIRSKLSKPREIKAKTREHLLAAIFLLAWFEVIHDQDTIRSRFPRNLADAVISGQTRWNRYSQELLSWLNTLDSKAAHMGGENLLSQKALETVSRYPTQIASSVTLENPDEGGQRWSENSCSELSECSPGSMVSMEQARSNPLDKCENMLTTGRIKQAILNATLQPALEWYLTSQSYCRRISSHDKHHRRRSTTDDEYEVINACKQLEIELFDLWASRPSVISLNAAQLAQVVSGDVATRLEEIFSVYLASFWILFVHLHRVSWWNFPLSETACRALDEVWNNMQRAYGEVNEQTKTKVVHPALLWPLFMFGCECKDLAQRSWVIEQLEALGEAKPVLTDDDPDNDTLPPFRLSAGATRNAKRASVLLRELIKQQDLQKVRVDDRDLSTKMFNCYFSIV